MPSRGAAAKAIHRAADVFADALHHQAVDEANWDDVRESGGIYLLVSLLKLKSCLSLKPLVLRKAKAPEQGGGAPYRGEKSGFPDGLSGGLHPGLPG